MPEHNDEMHDDYERQVKADDSLPLECLTFDMVRDARVGVVGVTDDSDNETVNYPTVMVEFAAYDPDTASRRRIRLAMILDDFFGCPHCKCDALSDLFEQAQEVHETYSKGMAEIEALTNLPEEEK